MANNKKFAAKRWSCAVNVFSTAGGSGNNRTRHPRAPSVLPPALVDGGRFLRDGSDDNSLNTVFDPNDGRYRCCCGQVHSTTGVRIITGMLSVTVVLEFWQLCWHFISAAGSTSPSPSSASGSFAQLLFGLFIVITVLLALWRENANLLLPYLVLQAIGLASVLVIFLAFFYVVVDHDLDTVKMLVENHGPVKSSLNDEAELMYMGWTLCVSCLFLLALQVWLIMIVFACWRYFRDKRNFFGSFNNSAHTSDLVMLRPLNRMERAHVDAGDQKEFAVVMGLENGGARKTVPRYWQRTMSANY